VQQCFASQDSDQGRTQGHNLFLGFSEICSQDRCPDCSHMIFGTGEEFPKSECVIRASPQQCQRKTSPVPRSHGVLTSLTGPREHLATLHTRATPTIRFVPLVTQLSSTQKKPKRGGSHHIEVLRPYRRVVELIGLLVKHAYMYVGSPPSNP
jgi:hypothetical protein